MGGFSLCYVVRWEITMGKMCRVACSGFPMGGLFLVYCLFVFFGGKGIGFHAARLYELSREHAMRRI